MTGWVKIPEEWFEQESTEDLPDDVVLVHLSALAYSARHSTDGRVPANAVHRLWQTGDPQAAIQHLVTSGLWFPLPAGGWQIREWETFILSAHEVERRRVISRETTERHRLHKLGDHSRCDRCSVVIHNRARDTSRDMSGDTSVTSSVTDLRSDPIRSDPKDRRGGGGEGDATTAAGAASPAPQREASSSLPPPHPFLGLDICCPLPPEHPKHTSNEINNATAQKRSR